MPYKERDQRLLYYKACRWAMTQLRERHKEEYKQLISQWFQENTQKAA